MPTEMTKGPSRLRSFEHLFIGGRWVEPASERKIRVVSPVTEQLLATVPEATEGDIDAAVAAARLAFDEGPWPRLDPAERASALLRIRGEIAARLDEMVETFSAEIGAPLPVSRAFHENALAMWDDMASAHTKLQLVEARSWADGSGHLVREPVGVVGTVIPWNGPVATASLKISPALAAGCTVVLKPAPEGPVSTMLMAEAIGAAELPDGVVSILPAGRTTGEHLVGHAGVDKVSFTGSTAAGKRVMSICSDRIARVTLELGGKSAAILAEDVELEEVLPTLIPAGVGHSGQVCAALTRVIVPRSRQEELIEAMAPAFEALKVGNPFDPETALGPLAAERQRDRVEGYITLGLEEGARLVCGGGRPAGLETGWYVEPTLLADVSNEMRVAREEIFGPVICLIPYDSLDEAVEIANDSEYGLSGAVYARDQGLAESVAARVRTGQIFVNSWGMCVVQPFGGFKQSGLGREGGLEGYSDFFESKLVQTVQR